MPSDAKSALQSLYSLRKELSKRCWLLKEQEAEFDVVEKWILEHPVYCSESAEQYRQTLEQLTSDLMARATIALAIEGNWPEPPTEREPIKNHVFPLRSGVYFAYESETGPCVYVGESKNLGMRCSFFAEQREDGNLRASDWASHLEFSHHERFFAECYYIGLLKPERNLPTKFQFRRR